MPDTPTLNKEQVYDQQIYPLVDQIIAIAKTHNISFIASFLIPTTEDPGLACSTITADETGKPDAVLFKALNFIRGGGAGLYFSVVDPREEKVG